jgi:hypothetical protein
MPFSTMMVFISPAMMLLPMEEEVDRTGEVVPMEEMEGTVQTAQTAQMAQEVTLTVTSTNLLFEGSTTVMVKPGFSNYCTKIPPPHTTMSTSFPTASTAYPLPQWSQTRTLSRPCQGT